MNDATQKQRNTEIDFLNLFGFILNSIANDRVPAGIDSLLSSTLGVALAKKDKINEIRPIGLRDFTINFTTKCVLKQLSKETSSIFSNINRWKIDKAFCYSIPPHNGNHYINEGL